MGENSEQNDINENFIINVLVTIILGVIIGLAFGYIIFKKKIYKGPNSSKITKEIYKDSKGEYIWEPVITICPLGTIHNPH